MSNETKRIEDIANWYLSDQLDIDKLLIKFRYESIKKYLTGINGLELGSAEGIMTQYLKNHFESLTIVEGSDILLSAVPDYDNVIKVHSLFENFKPQEKFDCIIIDHVLEHVEDPIFVLKLVKSWLSENGQIIVGVPNANSLHRLVAVKMGWLSHQCMLNDRDKIVGHRRVYTMEKFVNDIVDSGLAIIDKGGVFLKPLSNGQIEKNWSNELIQGYYELGKEYPEICAEIFVIAKHEQI